jgi:hypothetical protein
MNSNSGKDFKAFEKGIIKNNVSVINEEYEES